MNFPEIIVVEASAGSGKTFALAFRYISLLFYLRRISGRCRIDTILAITFTNKAMCEMRGRILEYLKSISLGCFKYEEELEKVIALAGISRREAAAFASEYVDTIIHDYDFFSVSTIDSFVRSLLSGCAFRLGLSASFDIRHEFDDYLSYSLDSFIENSARDKEIKVFLEECVDKYLFIDNKMGWHIKTAMLGVLKSILETYNNHGAEFVMSGVSPEQITLLKKDFLLSVSELLKYYPEDIVNKRSYSNTRLADFIENNPDMFDVKSVPSCFKYDTVPVKKGAQVDDDYAIIWRRARKILRQICEKESSAMFDIYIRLFNSIYPDISARAAADNTMFVSELNRKATAVSDIAVEEVFLRLSARFEHYLLDEFQDTSVLQWRNLERLVSEALAQQGSLFYVGDMKQAIYRFRGGQAFLFDAVAAYYDHVRPRKQRLDTNWRSCPEIIDFNNRVFSAENIKAALAEYNPEISDDLAGPLIGVYTGSAQRPSVPHERLPGFLKIDRFEVAGSSEFEELMPDLIKELLADLSSRYDQSRIAFLVRNKKQLRYVARILILCGYQVESDNTLDMRQNEKIRELVYFLRFLANPVDDSALACFITGDIFIEISGIDSSDLADFIMQSRTAQKNRNTYLYSLFREKYKTVWDKFIGPYFSTAGYLPVFELIVDIYEKFAVCDVFPESCGYFNQLLDFAKDNEKEYDSISDFLVCLEKAQNGVDIAFSSGDAIKVYTVHKAKGLAFDCVVLPYLIMQIKSPAESAKGFAMSFGDRGPALERLRRDYNVYSDYLKKRYLEEMLGAYSDELNAVYVALTRAVYEMHIMIPSRIHGSRVNPAYSLIKDSVMSGTPDMHKGQPVQLCRKYLRSEFKGWMDFVKNEYPYVEDVKDKAGAQYGTYVHLGLSKIKDTLLTEEQLRILLIHDVPERYLNRVAADVMSVCASEIFERFMHGEIFVEYEAAASDGSLRRMDRVVIKEGLVEVVDYKSSRKNHEKHISQTEEYVKLLKQIYPDHKVRGHLFYLDEINVVEVAGA